MTKEEFNPTKMKKWLETKRMLPAKEFNLSEKRCWRNMDDEYEFNDVCERDVIQVKDVKEFIRLLKEELCTCKLSCIEYDDYSCEEVGKIDKLAGEKLT